MPLSSVDVLRVPREPVQQQEDVSTACHPVTDARSLLQQAVLPHQLPTADARVQILGLLIDQVGFSKEEGHACARAARSAETAAPRSTHAPGGSYLERRGTSAPARSPSR